MITVGTDPEICCVDQNGAVVPSGWLFDKWEAMGLPIIPPPAPEPDMPPKGRKMELDLPTHGYYLYEDGASLEFNCPPTTYPDMMVTDMGIMLSSAAILARKAGYWVDIKASLPITPEVIQRGGVALSRFGCDPDSTPWDDRFDPSSVDANTCFNRFYGGHIHMGRPESTIEDFFYAYRWEYAVMCDLFLGVSDVLIDHSTEARTRRQVYGRIGRNRVQHYGDGSLGFEYRVPSNGWLCSPKTTLFMFSMAQAVSCLAMDEESRSYIMGSAPLDDLKAAINNTDQDRAYRLYTGLIMPLFNEYAPYNLAIHDLGIDLSVPLTGCSTDWHANWLIGD